MRAAIVVLAVAALAACATPTHIEGHRIRAIAAPDAGQALRTDALHAGAPAWFADGWRAYLNHARSGYAMLALDRGGHGGWYVYCLAAGCHVLKLPATRSIRDVRYKHRALALCRARIREAHPAARPDCALYAIGNKIVWQGPLPWDDVGDAPTRSEGRVTIGASPDVAGVSLALDLFEIRGLTPIGQ